MFDRKANNNKRCASGAFIAIDDCGYIREVFIMAGDDRQAIVVQGALARITQPQAWGWLRRLLGRGAPH
ncbi:MAG: hypothetical protein M0036_08100 [Desulfobacteraceae bacterium]|nr:hypothetical protein [Desulfobacteraceae bacterium]